MAKKLPNAAADKKLPGQAMPPEEFPPAEEDLGGGDICSLEEASSTDDDKPLD